jgi:hypothetical protein
VRKKWVIRRYQKATKQHHPSYLRQNAKDPQTANNKILQKTDKATHIGQPLATET